MKKFNNKNLLIISNGFPNNNGGFDCTFVKTQVDELAKYFKKVYVIVPTPYFPKILSKIGFKGYVNRLNNFNYTYNNVAVFYTTYFKLPNKISYKTFNLFNSVDKIIRKNKLTFDLIHAHFTFPSGLVAIDIKKIYGKKLIVTGHGFDVYDFPFRSYSNKNKFINVLKNCDFFITVSKKNMLKVNSIYNMKFKSKVIPNGVPCHFKVFSKKITRKELKLPLNKKIILHVGNYLINIKNQINLIKAVKELLKKRSDFILYLIGSGRDEQKIKFEINRLNLNKYIKVVGPKPNVEIPLWMNASDLFVLPSYKESFGVVNIEALSCKLPVITTINGGSEEIITSDDFGFLLRDPNDFLSLAKLINDGLNKDWDKTTIFNYSKKYNLKKIVLNIISIYNKLR